MVNKEYYYYY